MTWFAVLVASAACYGAKLAGISVPDRILHHRRIAHISAVLPIALLTTLVATQTFTLRHHLTLDARAAGLGAAVIAQALRAPFIAVVIIGAAATALVRLAA